MKKKEKIAHYFFFLGKQSSPSVYDYLDSKWIFFLGLVISVEEINLQGKWDDGIDSLIRVFIRLKKCNIS